MKSPERGNISKIGKIVRSMKLRSWSLSPHFFYYKNLMPINSICPSDLKNTMFSFKTLHIIKLLAKNMTLQCLRFAVQNFLTDWFRHGIHVCPKNMYEKLSKYRNVYDISRKINKILEFYMIFDGKRPKFYIIIARKIFSRILGEGRGHAPPSPTPMLLTWRCLFIFRGTPTVRS